MPNEREIAAKLAYDAAKIISTERGQQHGDVETSFTFIAEMWSAYINHAVFAATGIMPVPRISVNAVDVLEMMSLVKKARNVYGGKLPDHSVDDIGYTSLAGGLRLRETINAKVQDEVRKAQEDARGTIQSQGETAVETALGSGSDVDPPGESGVKIPAFLKERQKPLDNPTPKTER